MSNRINFLGFLVIVIVFTSLMVGCGGDDDIETPISVDMQQELDSAAISEFIMERGYDHAVLDTTRSGVIYLVLDEGSGDSIEYNDLVSLFISMKLTDGTLLTSNIDTVLQNHDLYDSTRTYSPIIMSHTPLGWAIKQNNFMGLQGFSGLTEGVTAVLNELNVGGRALMISPSIVSIHSSLANSVQYPIRDVFVIEVYPSQVRK